ncbi:MAG: site-specific DNA-methyltransferase [Bacteroidetes bacterium HGW-Bacteroidetes-17]|nr:MAG: site-specific DNA-methyltransferase [Bacteroidetes bacterium HGW-Bacteroidetes-17]
MDGTSLTPEKEKLNALRQILPEAFSEGKIDWEKLKTTLGEDINFSNERYVLNWAGKSDAFKVLQTPTTKTLIPVKDESVNFDETENIFIEGENLEVLKVLQKSYFGKIKMIYIDPPYNTGNDSFIYPDKFSESKADYEKRVGDKDEEGYMTKDGMFKKNSKENGQYHSNWMNMMYPRLFLAKNLLKQNGVIFVSIDDNEIHNLRMIMNEVFGEENFIEQIIWKNKYGAGAKTKGFISTHEYILCYSKTPIEDLSAPLSEDEVKKHNRKDSKFSTRGGYRLQPLQTRSLGDRPSLVYPIVYKGKEIWPNKQWVWSKERLLKAIENDDVEIQEKGDGFSVDSKQYIKDENGNPRRGKPVSVLNGPYTQEGTKEIRELFEGKDIFDFPKPSMLIETLLNISIEPENNDEIVLDFFSGSCPTAHAIFRYNLKNSKNKKFICVQLPEPCEEKSQAFKDGYNTIAEIGKERIRRTSKAIEKEIKAEAEKKKGQLDFEQNSEEIQFDLGFKVLKLSDSNFKHWQQIEGKDAKALAEQMKLFVDPISESATIENIVYELLLKSGKDLNSKIEKKDSFYNVNDNELVLMLEKATQQIIDSVIASKPNNVIALDKLFKGNDQLKTNTVLQMKDAGIEFKTI